MMVEIRPWVPQDASGVAGLETSFSTDRVFRVDFTGGCHCLREVRLDSPVTKRYAAPAPEAGGVALVAEVGGLVVGYAEIAVEAWNRRAIVRHLYVDARHRRHGVATALLDQLDAAARRAGARCLWVETQNVNWPAVQFYTAAGFVHSGLDTSLYDAVTHPGEIALFLTRDIRSPAGLRTMNSSTLCR